MSAGQHCLVGVVIIFGAMFFAFLGGCVGYSHGYQAGVEIALERAVTAVQP